MKTEKRQVIVACSLAAVILVAVVIGLYLPSDSKKEAYKAPKVRSSTSSKRIGGSVGEFNLSGPN